MKNRTMLQGFEWYIPADGKHWSRLAEQAERLAGLGFLASIGFTMSMFVTTLAFNSAEAYGQAKVGIFAASILGGIIGYRILSRR